MKLKKNKAIGFAYGLFGDAIICQTLCQTFKKYYPDSHLTFAVNKKYAGILPLLLNNSSIDGFHAWEGADNFPTKTDQDYLNKQNFDIIFTPKPQHFDNQWWSKYHYIEEFHRMYQLPPPDSNQIYLEKWFDIPEKNNKLITTSLHASGNQNNKTLDFDKIRQLYWELEGMGYTIVRLDQNEEFDRFCKNKWPSSKLSLIEAARIMLSGKLHITADTAFSWLASGYKHNSLLLLGCNYPGMTDPFSHVPENPNQRVLWSENVKSIPVEKIIETIRQF